MTAELETLSPPRSSDRSPIVLFLLGGVLTVVWAAVVLPYGLYLGARQLIQMMM